MRSGASELRVSGMRKPKTVLAWALWVPKYNVYVPVTDMMRGTGTPHLYPSRSAARKASLRRHSIPKRVKVVPQ